MLKLQAHTSQNPPWIDLKNFLEEAAPGQKIFDHAVEVIAAYFGVDVCRLYGCYHEQLMLMSIKGLFSEAIWKTRVAEGQGIVGEVLRRKKPVTLVNARQGAAYDYFPDTGEENYKSFLGIPFMQNDRVLGVLVLQTLEERFYSPLEIQELELLGSALASYFWGYRDFIYNLDNFQSSTQLDQNATLTLKGLPTIHGYAEGVAFVHQADVMSLKTFYEGPEAELKKLREAMDLLHQDLEKYTKKSKLNATTAQILNSYKLLAEDMIWVERVERGIHSGQSVEAAIHKAREDFAQEFIASKNPYLMNRIQDIEDLTNRLLSYISAQAKPLPLQKDTQIANDKLHHNQGQKKYILIAKRLGPLELFEYYRGGVSGLVLEEEQENSHALILCRSLGIPVVSGVNCAMEKINTNDQVLLNAYKGIVHVRPDENTFRTFQDGRTQNAKILEFYNDVQQKPSITLDGVTIDVMLNAALSKDFQGLEYADGIGLYRSEVPFMLYPDFPNIKVQTSIYKSVFKALKGKPLYFRLLDVGGDKPLPSLTEVSESNPHMGWRAIRFGLDFPVVIRHQVRALLRAANGQPVTILIPMVAEVSELKAVCNIIDMEKKQAQTDGYLQQDNIRIGVMVEIPSLSWELKSVIKHVSSLAVGSNDLFQFFYASDRANHHLKGRFDCLSVAFLRYLKYHVDVANQANVEIRFCGEMASNSLEALVLLGLGVRKLSITPLSIAPIKLMIRTLELQPFSVFLTHLLEQEDVNVRYSVQAYAKDHGILLGF